MDAEFKSRLVECGADVDTALGRFMGNESMYQKFLGRFLDDANYEKLGQYLQAGDYEEAYKCAHAMKGVTGNLGLDSLYHKVSDLVEELRGKASAEVDAAKTDVLWQELKKVYEQFQEIIRENLPA